ncbi:uncharacterized protein LOC132747348 [Ruditapes philippinarum]|uniref:uncharacterized protein LOC132747348 n=1 Tax=Ruditapes philippinarum TaxID=129788 RepID=UPI00295BC8E8|nr:uncharacterized protein LOC132747348 [Ruditapes philippinarum]
MTFHVKHVLICLCIITWVNSGNFSSTEDPTPQATPKVPTQTTNSSVEMSTATPYTTTITDIPNELEDDAINKSEQQDDTQANLSTTSTSSTTATITPPPTPEAKTVNTSAGIFHPTSKSTKVTSATTPNPSTQKQVSGKDIQYITSQLTDDLSSVSKWLTDNKLSLHLGKTESILFASKPRLRSCDQLNIVCNGTTITSTKSVKYLGADLDQCLSGESIANQCIFK